MRRKVLGRGYHASERKRRPEIGHCCSISIERSCGRRAPGCSNAAQWEEAAIDRWVRITERLARDLEVCGFDPVLIAMELCNFEDAVNAEIARRRAASSWH